MRLLLLIVTLYCTYVNCGVAKKGRIIDNHLSDKEFGTEDYDHEAFLGRNYYKLLFFLINILLKIVNIIYTTFLELFYLKLF